MSERTSTAQPAARHIRQVRVPADPAAHCYRSNPPSQTHRRIIWHRPAVSTRPKLPHPDHRRTRLKTRWRFSGRALLPHDPRGRPESRKSKPRSNVPPNRSFAPRWIGARWRRSCPVSPCHINRAGSRSRPPHPENRSISQPPSDCPIAVRIRDQSVAHTPAFHLPSRECLKPSLANAEIRQPLRACPPSARIANVLNSQ